MSSSSQSNGTRQTPMRVETIRHEKATPMLRTRLLKPDSNEEADKRASEAKKEGRLRLRKRFRKRRSDSSIGSDGRSSTNSAPMNGRSVKFHRLFDIPTSEVLIRTFPCALKAEILLQGTFYVSANFFCFYARLANKRKTIKISIRTVCEITREKTAIFFPNAIGIRTEECRYVFGSILSRESTLKLLMELWNAAICPVPNCTAPTVSAIATTRKILRSSSDSDLASLQARGAVLVKHRGHLHLNGDCVRPQLGSGQQLTAPTNNVQNEQQQQQLQQPPPQTALQQQQLQQPPPQQEAEPMRPNLLRQCSQFFLHIVLIIKSHLSFILSDNRMALGCSLIVLCLAYVLYLAYQIHLIQQNISERLEELLQSSSLFSPLVRR